MKKQCWKKVHSGRRTKRYVSDVSGNGIEIATERIHGIDRTFVVVLGEGRIADKEFDTKKEATKFANKYMKEHC